MMLRTSLALAGLVAFAVTARAQQALPSKVRPVTGPVRDAGIFHTATNTWTRKASAVHIGADVIYDNTFGTGLFSALSGDTYIDEGRLPGPSSPNSAISRTGCAIIYTVDGFQIGYCTDEIGGGAFQVDFFQSHANCSTIIGVTPTATFQTAGPSTWASGISQCWTVTIDLDGPPSTSFDMISDGTGTYFGNGLTNNFGWAIHSTLPPAFELGTGPLIAGDPTLSNYYDGTRWDSPVNYAEAGTGMGSSNSWRVESGSTSDGCYWFGGVPYASFHLELYADACVPPGGPGAFCFGDGSGTACPCANNGLPGNGCANSLFAAGANLSATGTASISFDTLVLTSTQIPDSRILFFQGTLQQSAGAGVVFGDGKRCAGGTITRIGSRLPVANSASYPIGGDPPVHTRGSVTAPGTRTYQGWYRNPAAFCTTATFNLSNGLELVWAP